jgi:hypothetical protein
MTIGIEAHVRVNIKPVVVANNRYWTLIIGPTTYLLFNFQNDRFRYGSVSHWNKSFVPFVVNEGREFFFFF